MQTREWHGYQVGDAEAAGDICGVSGETYQAYTRRQWVTYREPPKFVTRDLKTGRKLYPLRVVDASAVVREYDTVEKWHAGRPGRGYWGKHREVNYTPPQTREANTQDV